MLRTLRHGAYREVVVLFIFSFLARVSEYKSYAYILCTEYMKKT